MAGLPPAQLQVALSGVSAAVGNSTSNKRSELASNPPEMERPAGIEPGGNQVLHDLLLAVDRDPATAGESREVDPVPLPLELQLDAVVNEPFFL